LGDNAKTRSIAGGGRLGRWSLWLVLTVAVVAMAMVPLVYVVNAAFYQETRFGLSSVRSLAAVFDVFATTSYLGYLGNALLLAALVTALSLIAGVAMAVLVGRTDLRGKTLWEMLIVMPLYLSPFTGLMAWIALGSAKTGFVNVAFAALVRPFAPGAPPLLNIWTFGGVVLVMFLFFCPFVYLFTIGSLRAMDTSLEEAARAAGANTLQTLAKITLPMSLPAILAAGLLVFILCMETYTIPGIIGSTAGFTTLPWQIFQDSSSVPVHRAHAAAAATLLLLITITGVWLQRRLTRTSEKFVTVGGKGFRGRPLPLGAYRWLATGLVALYVLAADVLPFGALLLSSVMKYSAPTINAQIFTLKHFAAFFTTPNMLSALWNTIFLGVLAGIACVAIGFLISLLEIRMANPATRVLAFLSVLPVAVPGIVYGIGLLWTYVQTPLYGTIWILLVAYIAKFLPYGVIVSRSGILQIHPELEESARMSGASPWRALSAITIPLVQPTLIAILFFVVLQSIKELSASLFLYTENSQVLSVLTWHYMDAGDYQFAAAIGVVQTVIMIGLVVATRAVFRVRLETALGKELG
jgi:iron(III) transport system permease protein